MSAAHDMPRSIGCRPFLDAVRVVVLGVLALLPLGCRVDTYDLKRVGTPVRFGEVRETAAWIPDFDPAWWGAIDEAYAAYDLELERVVRDEWEPLVLALGDAGQTGLTTDEDKAKAMWQRHRRVQRALGEVELGFVLAVDERLPPEADGFVELLRQRMLFWRAASQWTPHASRPPGPLEVLALNGGVGPDAGVVAAATAAYARLAPVAARAAEARFDAYIRYCADLPAIVAEIDAATAARAAAGGKKAIDAAQARVEKANKRRENREKRLRDRDRREADEELRVAILREGRAFAECLSDEPLPADPDAGPGEPVPTRRSDFRDRLDAFLHAGIRSAPSLRAMRSVALRLLDELELEAEAGAPGSGKPGAQQAAMPRGSTEVGDGLGGAGDSVAAEREARATAVREAFANYFRAQAPLREQLASPDPAVRQRAYQGLLGLVEPLYSELREQIGAERMSAVEGASLLVASGSSTARDAVLRMLEPPPPPDLEPPDGADEALGRADSERIFVGAPLAPSVVSLLAMRLALDEGARAELSGLRDVEAAKISASTKPLIDGMGEAVRQRGRDESIPSYEARARTAMRELRATLERVRSIDRAANERILAEAARIGGVGPDDTRISSARLELDLLGIVGTTRRSTEMQAILGMPQEAIVSPFEMVRSMEADEVTRDAAELLVLDRAVELRAAQAELEVGLLRNMERFLARMYLSESSSGLPAEAWHQQAAGTGAAALRFAIGDEIGSVLGPAAADAYFARMRSWCQPGMEPPRTTAFRLLDGFAGGRALDASDRDSTEAIRSAVAELLDAADEARVPALRALHEFRSSFLRGAELQGNEWAEAPDTSAIAWFLRSRVVDGDDRAAARCESLLAGLPGFEEGVAASRRRDVRLPQRIAPYFGGR